MAVGKLEINSFPNVEGEKKGKRKKERK